jgi:hypothetical protein
MTCHPLGHKRIKYEDSQDDVESLGTLDDELSVAKGYRTYDSICEESFV